MSLAFSRLAALDTDALDAASAAHRADPFGTSGAHLADYSFRFDTAAEDEVAAPAPQGAFSLAETFAEIARRGARLNVGSGGVRLAHAHRMPDLGRAVRRHADALALWVSLGLDAEAPARLGARYVPFGAPAWDEPTRLHAAWFALRFEPSQRLELRPGVTVTDLPVFRTSVAQRLAAGPDAPGAGSLRADLSTLFERHAFAEVPAPAEAPTFARAA